MFGIDILSSKHSMGNNFLVLYLKFYIYRCKFHQYIPDFKAFLNLMKIKLKTEYKFAEKKGKLNKHPKKFTFNFDENWFFNLFIYLIIC